MSEIAQITGARKFSKMVHRIVVFAEGADEAELLAAYAAYREVLEKAAAAGIEVRVAKGD